MKKCRLLSSFFEEDALIFTREDEDACKLLDEAYGGAKQSTHSLEDLMCDLPEYVAEEKTSSVPVNQASPASGEEERPRKEGALAEGKLFKHLMEHYPIRKFGNMPYLRRGCVWLPVSASIVGALLMESLPENEQDGYNSKQADAVASRIMQATMFHEDSLKLPRQAMLFRNGCFDPVTFERITPQEDWFFPFSINADFNPDCESECPVFDRFMAQISNHDDEIRDLFMAFLAYCLMPGAPLKKLFVLGPEHDTGKSLLMEWIQFYVGEEQTTSIPLEKFHNHFVLADIVGKSIVVSPELPSDSLPSKATIVAKNITGHDKIQIQQKYLKAFKYAPHAKIICGTNHPVKSMDLPFFRRILVLPCLNSIPPSAQDEELLLKLYAEEKAIMVKIMLAARRFILNDMEFPYCEASVAVKLDWQRNNVPYLARFIEERCVLDADSRCWSEDLHDAFRNYCSERGASVPSVRAFVDAIKIGWPELHQDRWSENCRQGRGFYGINLR